MAATLLRRPANPMAVYEEYTGWDMPDPLVFITSPTGLNRPNLYPRQATVLKILFLRDDQFTDYDHAVIGQWIENWKHSADDEGIGNNGIQPDIYERIAICKAQGRKWFRETQAVWGRRGSKGHVGALAGAVVLWTYMGIGGGDPQEHYGIDRDKKMAMQVFAGKKEQAKTNQWGDIFNVITGAPCFSDYISRALGETLTVFAPHDKVRIHERLGRGVDSANDMATFVIQPLESTVMASRGPAAFCLDPETPVLTSDLAWVPIKSLEAGDRLVGLDEVAPGPRQQRKLRDAEVLKVWRTRQEALRLTFEDGSSVVCSPGHRWLTRSKGLGGTPVWSAAGRLTVGSQVRHLVDPWDLDQSRDGGYLAGFFDGEGCVVKRRADGRPVTGILYSQNPGVVLDGVQQMLKERGFTPLPYNQQARLGGPGCQQWYLAGVPECLRFLGQVGPTRLGAKADLVWEGATVRGGSSPNGRQRQAGQKTIVSIERLPEQDLIDIETTTRTFIANGFVSHNSQFYDEMAHVVKGVAKANAEAVWGSATPALDQFGKDAFVYEPSSPWQMLGQFYVNYRRSLETNADGSPTYPDLLMTQLTSWDIYTDWEVADQIPMWPGGPHFKPLKRAMQEYDDNMVLLEKANPETFRVERRSYFAAALNAYLSADKIASMWKPWPGEEDVLTMKSEGRLAVAYRAHGDPSKSGANFGFAIGHAEYPEGGGLPHVIFDLIKRWSPGDFENHEIDYEVVGVEIEGYMDAFMPGELTFDQFNSVATIQRLQRHSAQSRYPKQVQIYERTATGALNWKTYETFKTALGMGLVHAPFYDLLNLELTFLQDIGHNKVDHPTSGPVQTKDVADCVAIVVYELIGEQMALMADMLGGGLSASVQTGFPTGQERAEKAQEDLSAFTRARGARVGEMTGAGRRRRR